MNNFARGSPEKTTPVTFRITESMLDKLKEDAEEQRISLNTLVMQVFNHHIWCNTEHVKGMMVPISKARLKTILEKLTDDEIVEVSQANSKTDPKALQYMLHGEYSESALMESIAIWARAAHFELTNRLLDHSTQISIHHDMGIKCSRFFAETFVEAFLDASGKRPKLEVLENSFIVTIPANRK
jgi:hypothetical protein